MRIHELEHLILYVSNLTRSVDFYKNILGFTEIHRDLHTTLYSSSRTHHELVGSANHHVTHSLYILDQDDNEIELYIDVDDSWKTDIKKIMKPAEKLSL